MTNAELLVLLREAQRYVASHDCNSRCNCVAAYDLQRLFERIKAAIAERQDSAKGVVEWEQRQGSYIHDDGVNELRVYLWGDQWHWHTVVEYRANGIGTTETEDKS
jgi:hypothetical protein